MKKFDNYSNDPLTEQGEDLLMNISGFSGMVLLIAAAVLNLAGMLGGLSFFAVFVLSLTLLIGAIGLLADKNESNRRMHNSDPYSI